MEVNGKKVTVKFFLNKELKKRTLNIDGQSLYPLYARVTYDRKSTKFALGNNLLSEVQETSLKDNPSLKNVRNAVEKIVKYEVLKSNNGYTLNGLGNRIRTYATKLVDAIKLFVSRAIYDKLEHVITVAQFKELDPLSIDEKIVRGANLFFSITENDHPFTEDEVVNLVYYIWCYDASRIISRDLNIYDWLIGEARLEVVSDIENALMNEPDRFSFVETEEFLSKAGVKIMVKILDDFCEQLVELGYTDQPHLKGITWNKERQTISIEVVMKNIE